MRDSKTAMRTDRSSAMPYLPALDGLRALAVTAVLLYHAGVPWARGGYLGVEVFFVLSGYLITSLLLEERRRSGRVSLRAFWLRRARRLLPELFVVIIATLAFSVLFAPDAVSRLRVDTLAAIGYVMNWRLVFGHQSYFESFGRPPLLQHLWSLAVEEQFYLCWPPLFVLSTAWLRPRGALVLATVGAITSALLMAMLYHPGTDPSRVYFGTDTRAAGVLTGAGLAFFWAPWRNARTPGHTSQLVAIACVVAPLAGLATLVGLLRDEDPFLFRGGFALVDAATALLIAGITHPGAARLAKLLGNRVLRWGGTRSYGIYLWHWPVFMVTRPGPDVGFDGLPLWALRLGATLSLAELSYRFVYQPVRRGALGELLNRLRHARSRRGWALRLGSALASALVIVLAGMVATARDPGAPGYLQRSSFHGIVSARGVGDVAFGRAAIVPGLAAGEAAPMEALSAAATAPPVALATPTPTPLARTPTPYVPTDILAVGDSVMLGAINQLGRIGGTIEVDAEVGRQPSTLVSILQARRAANEIPPVVIVHIGNNGPFSRGQFDQVAHALSAARLVVFVNLKVDRWWEAGNNSVIASGVASYSNMVLVDWHAASADHPELFWDDGLHLRPAGADLYASLIAAAIHPPAPAPTPTPTPTATPTPGATPAHSPVPGGARTASATASPSPSGAASPSSSAATTAQATSSPAATAGAITTASASPGP